MSRVREAVSVAGADLRGFQHQLEPLRQKQEWQLETLRSEWADSLHKRKDAQGRLEEARQVRDGALSLDRSGRTGSLDPLGLSRSLAWLAHLSQEVARLEKELKVLEASEQAAMQACAKAQGRLDVLLNHRDDALLAYVAEESRKRAVQADDDWLSRVSWRDALGADVPGGLA